MPLSLRGVLREVFTHLDTVWTNLWTDCHKEASEGQRSVFLVLNSHVNLAAS